MTFNATRHHLPTTLVAADRPLSADVIGRTVEAVDYLWQVTTGTADQDGAALAAPQGHTHDGVRDQTLTADSQVLTGWPFGFGSPRLRADSSNTPNAVTPHLDPNGGWADGPATGTLTPVRSMVQVPFDTAGAPGQSAAFSVKVLIEKGTVLSAANAVTVTATVGGVAVIGNSAAVATGLETITLAFAAGALAVGGANAMQIGIATLLSGDRARVWHAVGIAA